MRVAFLGNMTNCGYRLCKWFRTVNANADLFIIPGEANHVRSRPQDIDAELADGYPDWIKTHAEDGKWWFRKYSETTARIDHEYDVGVVVGGKGLLQANALKRLPYVYVPIGADILSLPFEMWQWGRPFRRRVMSHAARQSIERAHRILLCGAFIQDAVVRLGHVNKLTPWAFPEDIEANLQRVDQVCVAELENKYASYKGVFVWLTRLNLDPANENYKCPEHFVEAYSRIIKDGKHRVRAIIGEHGNDVEAFKSLCREAGIIDHIDWVPHLSYRQMLAHCCPKNFVVCDSFRARSTFGGLTREALSVGGIVVRRQEQAEVDLCFGPNCPVYNVDDVPALYACMSEILSWDDEQLLAARRRMRDWAMKYLHYGEHMELLLKILKQTAYVSNLSRSEKP